jgi:hypothetical protein
VNSKSAVSFAGSLYFVRAITNDSCEQIHC